jgi:hypothetical protein
MTPDEQRQLLARAAIGDISPSEADRLLVACRTDPELLRQFSQFTIVERLLAHFHLYPDDETFMREVRDRLADSAPLATPRPVPVASFLPRWSFAATAAIALICVGWWAARPAAVPARVLRMESAAWEAGSSALRIGDGVTRGPLQLAHGLVELGFARGARVIVEGPARFEVLGPEHAMLHQGRAVTRMPKGTKGFVLDSPRGRLIDQGTEFGVSVSPSGDTEVHVLKGLVEAVPQDSRRPLHLAENQAARLKSGSVEQFTAEAIGFITDLPPISSRALGYLHWSFDEGTGDVSYNRGRGLGLANARAIRRSFPTSAPGPRWITGQFGGGIAFNGRGSYVECEFPGIAGGEPRTVAFWVKVPRDSTDQEGYGIINWGTSSPGLAWQISVNPNAAEGPLGRLRLGVHEGWVVGTTDLRDDRWHHCSVVMYGGHRPDSATHILLYLDGELEPAARKAVREIRTQISGDQAHNMWLGRNLNYRNSAQQNPVRAFFRGSLDEVFVFNASLNQEQIRSLMMYNRIGPAPDSLAQSGSP